MSSVYIDIICIFIYFCFHTMCFLFLLFSVLFCFAFFVWATLINFKICLALSLLFVIYYFIIDMISIVHENTKHVRYSFHSLPLSISKFQVHSKFVNCKKLKKRLPVHALYMHRNLVKISHRYTIIWNRFPLLQIVEANLRGISPHLHTFFLF